ncbi:hypothetical protein [Pelagibacterium lacus]|nr:hypothetical protein [Pelagibacterium lacus]
MSIGAETYGLPGPVPTDAWHVLDHAVSVIHRVTPWATVIAAPTLVAEATYDDYPCREFLRRRDSEKNYVKLGGRSFGNEGLIALSLYSWSGYLISTAYHEAWHQLERILDKKILDEIDGHLIPLSWGSAYMDSMVERRARCFETWAMRFEEGMPGLRLSSQVDAIFDAAATGEIAKEWYKMQQKAARGR